MKVFISSLIRGLEKEREAAAAAARTLGHEIIRAEDFGASPDTPQQVCLAGVREADVTVLIIGARYGAPQASGLSATDEEYREARDREPVLVFIQDGVDRQPEERSFLTAVRAWASGHFTLSFTTPDELREVVTRALHQLELSRSAGTADEHDMVARAMAEVGTGSRRGIPTLSVVVAGGPRQQVLRPADIERPELARRLTQEALFGAAAVFDSESGTKAQVEGHALVLTQDDASVTLDPAGTIRITRPAHRKRDRSRPADMLLVLIEEDIRGQIEESLRYAGWVLDLIDEPRRISDIVPVVALLDAGASGWKTRAEHAATPNQMTMGRYSGSDGTAVHLSPARRHRAALSHDAAALAEDLTVLLRRQIRG